MKTNLHLFFTGTVGMALLACSCASEKTAPTPIVINPPAAAPAAPVAPVVVAPVTVPVFHGGLAVVRVDSAETAGENGKGENAVDGDPSTIWHTQWQDANPACPHEIVIELASPATIKGFTYLPRQDDSDHGCIKGYEFFTSNDGQDFDRPVAKGEFEDGKNLKTILFAPQLCRFIKLKALSEVNGEAWTSAAEIGVVLQ